MIFDLDGTLVDTLQDLTTAMNVALAACSLPTRSAEECRMMIGNALPMFARRAVGPDNEQLSKAVADTMRTYYCDNCLGKSRLYDGLAEVIDRLRRKRVRLAVLTNKDQDVARKIVEHFFGAGVFEYVVGTVGEARIKPDPGAALSILARMNLSTDEVLFVGDSDVDMQTAAAAGIRSVGVTWGFRGRDELAAARADIIIDSPAEILDLLA
jgi:phosphoglycolate phosphatase